MLIPLEENARLNIELGHRDGVYRVYVRKEFVEEHELENGVKYHTIMSMPLNDGNFAVRVKEGRKSAKFLESGSKYLESKKDILKKLWLGGNYNEMVSVFSGMVE